MDIPKLLQKAFEAGENYANSGEFAYHAPNFEEWFASIEPELAKENAQDIVDLVRFVISQWASIGEQREPDHELLIQNFIRTELVEYVNKYQANLEKKRNELKG